MQQALAERSDPQAAIPVAEQTVWPELSRHTWKCIGFGFSAGETSDGVGRGHQQRVAIVLKTLDGVSFTRHGMKLRKARFPLPESVLHGRPDTASPVFVHTKDRVAEASTFALALDMSALNHAQPRIADGDRAGPDR